MTVRDDGSQARPGAGRRLGDDVSELVREELAAVGRQLRTAASHGAVGLGLLAAAGVSAAWAGQATWLTLLRLLETRMPRPVAALSLAAVFGGSAAGLGILGARSIERARRDAAELTPT